MVANVTILQDIAAALPAGNAKVTASTDPAAADFSAVLAALNPGKGEAPGQAVAIAHRPEFVTAMLTQRHGAEAEQVSSPFTDPDENLQPASNEKKLWLSGETPASNILAEVDVLKGKAKQPALCSDQPVKPSKAAPTTMLPMAVAPVVADEMETSEADFPVTSEEEPIPSDDQANVQLGDAAKLPTPLMAGPAISVPPADTLPDDAPPVQSQPKATITGGGSKPPAMPGMLPGWAAEPAQIHAQVGKPQPGNSGKAIRPSADKTTVPLEAANRQALALELAALSLGRTAPGEAPAVAEQRDNDLILSAPIALAKTAEIFSPGAANPVNLTAPLPDMVAVWSPAIPAADTAAALGEQVIDMGVDGQWIDRMAREIADVAAGTGRATFTLHPQNLGKLQVEILQREEGANVRMIAETDAAAEALNQGRHQFQQDARLQAIRINDLQVERAPVERGADNLFTPRAQSSGQEMAGQQGQSHAFHKKPQIEAVSSRVTEQEQDQAASERTGSLQARYA